MAKKKPRREIRRKYHNKEVNPLRKCQVGVYISPGLSLGKTSKRRIDHVR